MQSVITYSLAFVLLAIFYVMISLIIPSLLDSLS
jgi:hypothetical protein